MKVIYDPAVERNGQLKSKTEKRAADLERVIGVTYPGAEAVWKLRADAPSRELALEIHNDERQAEELVSFADLDGNGAFDAKLHRMKDSLAHNGVWRIAVRELIANARRWCEQELPGAMLRDYTVQLYEERSGKYELPALEVRTADGLLMWVEPIAGWVVNPTWIERDPKAGTKKAIGRADLLGPGGPIYLYCLEPDGKWIYQASILYGANNLNLFYNLDKDSFHRLAEVCFNG